MDMWNEIKTAYQVAKLGTVTAAAESLGVHRATVIRHIDSLEAELGKKLFQRHIRGYTATEVGLDLLRIAQTTDEQFSQWVLRSKGSETELSGELLITSIDAASPLLMPAIQAFKAQHPQVMIRYLISNRLFKLEYGEAHIAVRTGGKPQEPDNVVQHFTTAKIALYAHHQYAEQHGLPKTVDDFDQHTFVGTDNTAPLRTFQAWFQAHVPQKNIALLSTSNAAIEQAVCAGLGLGLLPCHLAEAHPDLIEVMPPQEVWDVNFWLVTHGDLHRTEKVQAFLRLVNRDTMARI
jgi:DNA-binding transcriptional LysR family regulator